MHPHGPPALLPHSRMVHTESGSVPMKSFIVPLLAASAMVLAAPAVWAQPSVSAVLNGASYSALLSPGCWAVIYGARLAPATVTAPSLPLPTNLSSVTVTIGGVRAPLLYVRRAD